MTEAAHSDSDAARIIFYVVAALMAIYGLGLLLFPQMLFNLSEDPGVPANPGWVRWAGGLLIGTATAAWLAVSNAESQRPLAVGFAVAFTLIALALFYSTLVGDYRGAPLWSWILILGNAGLAAAMWWLSVRTPPERGGAAPAAKTEA